MKPDVGIRKSAVNVLLLAFTRLNVESKSSSVCGFPLSLALVFSSLSIVCSVFLFTC